MFAFFSLPFGLPKQDYNIFILWTLHYNFKQVPAAKICNPGRYHMKSVHFWGDLPFPRIKQFTLKIYNSMDNISIGAIPKQAHRPMSWDEFNAL